MLSAGHEIGFLAGSCCSSSSLVFSPWSLQLHPPLMFTSPKAGKEKRAVLASLRQDSSANEMLFKKRSILFMGFAVTPFINLRGEAVEQISAGENLVDEKQKAEANPLFSIGNVIGVLASGILAPLYLSIKKEKEASDAALTSFSAELKEKQASIGILEKKYESDLASVRDARKIDLEKASKEKQALLEQIEQVNCEISNLGADLKAVTQIADERRTLVEKLESSLRKTLNDKREIEQHLETKGNSIAVLEERVRLLSSEISDKEVVLQNATSELVEKEKELAELNSSYEEARDQVASLKQELEELAKADLNKVKELESKKLYLNDLNVELASTRTEIDNARKNFDTLAKEYRDYKSSAEITASSNAKLLEEREQLVQELENQLAFALEDIQKNRALVNDSTKERDELADLLSTELKNVKILEHELRITQDSLDKSRAVASDLTKQLEHSKTFNSKLEAEARKIKDEYHRDRVSLENKVAEAKQEADILADELRSAKEQVNSSQEELQKLAHEFSAVVEKRDHLEKELLNARTTAEKAVHDLQKEKKLVSSLKKEVNDIETRVSDDKKVNRSLETHLEEARRSLDEMNQYVSTISKELEATKSQISDSKDEKETLQKALEEQKRLSQEAKENLDEAHSAIMRIGKERERLDLKGRKLEDELSSAKGEILRLRSELSLSSEQENYQQTEDENGSKAPVSARRVARRKKVTSSQQD